MYLAHIIGESTMGHTSGARTHWFAACGASCGLAPCFKPHEKKSRTKVSEGEQPRNGGIHSWGVKLQRLTLVLHRIYYYLAKKSSHNLFLFACMVVQSRHKWEFASHVACYFSKNKKKTNYFLHCTNTSLLLSSKYEADLKKIIFEGHKNCKTNITFC